MSKLPVLSAPLEDILFDIGCTEDPDQILRVAPTETGGVFIEDVEGFFAVQTPTFREALIEFGIFNRKHRITSRLAKCDWSEVLP